MSLTQKENTVIEHAHQILARKVQRKSRGPLSSPSKVTTKIKQITTGIKSEETSALILSNRHTYLGKFPLIGELSNPNGFDMKELITEIIRLNGCALVLYRAHPEPVSVDPRGEDRRLCRIVTEKLSAIDIRVLDMIILSGDSSASLAERGFM